MIINNQRSDVLEVVGQEKSGTATINTQKIQKLQYILTEGLYKDAMSATIVELSNNGVDSILESGKDPIENPVVVKLHSENNTYTLSIEDKGTGMSKDFFEEFFMSMLSSTKENSDDMIGHFGLGSKAWVSLKRSVTFTIVKDGWKCKYLCYKGEELIDYDLIYEEDTDEENGVLFEMPINDWREYNEFKLKAKQKLAYYDTVVLIMDGVLWENKIYRHELFQYSSNPSYNNIHLCLKDVVYEIDYDKLGISPIPLGIALRFGLKDGIVPTPSRENYLNSRETLDLIKKRIGEVADYFITQYNDSIKDKVRFMDVYSIIGSSNKYVNIGDNGYDVQYLAKYSSIKVEDFQVEDMELRPAQWYKGKANDLMGMFDIKAEYGNNGVWRTKRIYTSLTMTFHNKTKVVLVDPHLAGNVKEYIKERVGKGVLFVSLDQKINLGWYIRNVVGLFPKEQWRKGIVEWQNVEKQIITDFCLDYRGIEKSSAFQSWLALRKEWLKENRGKIESNYTALNKQEDEVTIAYSRKTEIGYSQTFEKKTYKLSEIHKTPHLTIVFMPDQRDEAKSLAALVKREKVAIVGVREWNKIKHVQQFKLYNEFMSDNKPFRRIATALLAEKVVGKYNAIYRSSSEIIKTCLKNVEEDLTKVRAYINEHAESFTQEAGKAIADLAKEMNLYDEEMLPLINRVDKNMETFSFIQHIKVPSYYETDKLGEINKMINQMLLFRKKYYNELENYELVYKPQVEEKQEEATF